MNIKKLLCYKSSCYKRFYSERARKAHLRCSHPKEFLDRKKVKILKLIEIQSPNKLQAVGEAEVKKLDGC